MTEYLFSQTPVETEKIETKNRKICTPIPSPKTLQTIEECSKYEPYSMNNQLPIVWDRAVGHQVYDNSGNCWIDFTSTIFVANVGHAHPRVCNAIETMIKRGLLNAYYYPTEIRAELAKLLVELTPSNMNKVFFLSTGSETTEAAIKMMKLFGMNKVKTKSIIIGLENSFHGKTMGAQFAGGKKKEQKWIGYEHPQILHLPFPYPWTLEKQKIGGEDFFYKTLSELEQKGVNLKDIAGFITEPYQGWCAVFLPTDYIKAMRKWCDENDALITMDEVQSGFGRTGKLFAFEHFGLVPDIICCAKGISSSLPISAVVTSEEIIGEEGSFNSTHGGNPVAAAASIASIRALLDENLISESERKGKLLHKLLLQWQKEKSEYVTQIYCKGLLAGIFINNPHNPENNIEFVDKLIEIAVRKGLMSIRTSSGTLKLGPPLSIPDDALIEGIEILKESLDKLIKENEHN